MEWTGVGRDAPDRPRRALLSVLKGLHLARLLSMEVELAPGDRVTWMREDPVDLFETPVFAEILKVSPRWVKIRVWRVKSNGKKVAVTKKVDRKEIVP